MKKIVILISAVLILLCGCADNSGDSMFSPNNPVTIIVWTYYNGAQLAAFDSMVDEFNATVGKEKGIIVESYSQGSVSDLEANVIDSAQGKVGAQKLPSLFAAYADTAFKVNNMGLVADIKEYFTEEELALYIDSYIEEGCFSEEDGLKIFPVAKSAEVFLLNKTEWNAFAKATGAEYSDFSTIEGLTATAKKYYEWTDKLTPRVKNDGKAFFGRDAMANYMLIGAMQLGEEIFTVEDGKMTVNFSEEVARKLWDNYYVPFVNGWFAASGRFRSDDVRIGNIIAYVGSSSSATFFPKEVMVSDTESHTVEMGVFSCPQFEDSLGYAVQQGAGFAVTKGTDAEIAASVEFLKWFTSFENNITFSVGSGYMPVISEANDVDAIVDLGTVELNSDMENILTISINTVNINSLYTPKAFTNGSEARSILEYSMSDKASADRAIVVKRLNNGEKLNDAVAEFMTDECFMEWYNDIVSKLKDLEG